MASPQQGDRDQRPAQESPANASTCSPPSTQRGREATPSRARSAGAPASGSSGTASGFWTTPAGPNPLQQGTLQVAPSPAGMGSAAATCEPQQQPLHATRTARPGTQMGTAGQLTFINGLLPCQRLPPSSSASPATGWSTGLATSTDGKPTQMVAFTAPACSTRTISSPTTLTTSSRAWSCHPQPTCPHHHPVPQPQPTRTPKSMNKKCGAPSTTSTTTHHAPQQAHRVLSHGRLPGCSSAAPPRGLGSQQHSQPRRGRSSPPPLPQHRSQSPLPPHQASPSRPAPAGPAKKTRSGANNRHVS